MHNYVHAILAVLLEIVIEPVFIFDITERLIIRTLFYKWLIIIILIIYSFIVLFV